MLQGNSSEGSSTMTRVINKVVAISYFNTYNRDNHEQERKSLSYGQQARVPSGFLIQAPAWVSDQKSDATDP